MIGIQTMNSIGPANSLGKLSLFIRRSIVMATFAMTFLGLVSHVQGHDIAKEMRDGATLFLKSLSDDQAIALKFKFDDELRKNWQFIPMERKGLGLKQMKPHQRGLAMVLVQTALSHRGFSTSMQIMAMEQVLFDLEKNALKRDPAKYHLFLFGTPSADSSWGWRIEGHHLSISVTVADGKSVVIAPAFLGANPAVVKTGPLAGTSVLGDIEAKGRELVKQLTVEQKATAVFTDKAPRDVINGPARKQAEALTPAGLTASEMSEDQQKLLRQLLGQYLDRFRSEIASADRDKIEQAGFEKVSFAWAGQIQAGKPHYFRVQGPTFIFEYDNTQNGANHAHALWRDFKDDFGEDTLRKHYQTHPHDVTSTDEPLMKPAAETSEKSANP